MILEQIEIKEVVLLLHVVDLGSRGRILPSEPGISMISSMLSG